MRLALALWTLLLAAGAALPSQAPATAKKQAARSRGARVASRSGVERCSGTLTFPRTPRDADASPRTPPAVDLAAPPPAAPPSAAPSPSSSVAAVSFLRAGSRRGRAPPPAA